MTTRAEQIDRYWVPKWVPWWGLRETGTAFEVYEMSSGDTVFSSSDPAIARRFFAAPLVYRAAGALLEVQKRRALAPDIVSRRRVELFEEVLRDMLALSDGDPVPMFLEEPDLNLPPIPLDATEERRTGLMLLYTVLSMPIHGSKRSPSNPWHVAMVLRGLEPHHLNSTTWEEEDYICMEDLNSTTISTGDDNE